MRFTVAGLLLSVFAMPAIAAPSCFGEPPCLPARVSYYTGGLCVGWYEPGLADWQPVGYCVRYEDIAPDERGSIAELWFGDPEKRGEVFDRQVTRELGPVEQAALASLFVDRPPSLYAVKYSSFGTRPTYPVINGARGSKSNGRIAVGEPCDCSLRFGDYCLVREATVALCEKR